MPGKFSRLRIGIALVVTVGGLTGAWIYTKRQSRPPAEPGSEYVDAAACEECHADKAAGYRKTGMGRSFARVGAETYPKIPEGLEHAGSTEMTFAQPIPEGIDCQRCHGPGQRHVRLASGGGTAEQIRAAIVNPKRLAPEREFEVCMQCHLETTSIDLPHSIRRFDRGPFSYRPGEPLGDFRIEFDRPGGMNDRFEIAQGAYRLRESQCFLKNAGKLRCTTCHDPHDIPRGAAATAHYNSVCETCHAATIEAAAAPHARGSDCTGATCPSAGPTMWCTW